MTFSHYYTGDYISGVIPVVDDLQVTKAVIPILISVVVTGQN